MNTDRKPLPSLLAMAALLTFPAVAAPELCPIEVDTPALLTVEATAGTRLATVGGGVTLEESSTHAVIAVDRPGILWLEASACDLQTTLTRAEVREHRGFGDEKLAFATSFHPLGLATKEEDHEIDPDPGIMTARGQASPLLTLIHLEGAHPTKEEDHEIDPDPGFRSGTGGWAEDWSLAADFVRRLGPGWYFVVRDGEVVQELLIETR